MQYHKSTNSQNYKFNSMPVGVFTEPHQLILKDME